MTATNDFIAANKSYAEDFSKGGQPIPPAKRVAVVACMDARIETGRLLGLEEGDAHVIRNAGGVVTDDVKAQIEEETGVRPSFALEAFPDLEDDVRQSIRRIEASPFVPKKDKIRGFVYDVETGRLNEVADQERLLQAS